MMGWREWPSWVKVLGIISILIILLISIFAITSFLMSNDDMAGLGLAIGAIWIMVIIGLWIFGFFIRYLLRKNKKWLANIICSIILISITGYIILGIIQAISNYYGPYPPVDISLISYLSHGAYIFIPSFTIIIYLIISLILINRNRNQ
jgi:membrane protease YdiL (CAAX protease family)